jgi:hypothetical protein
MYTLPNIIINMGVLVWKPEGTTLENLVVDDRVILKLMLQEKSGGCGVDLVARDRDQWWMVFNMVMDHCVT